MRKYDVEKEESLAPGLRSIITEAEAAGWVVRRDGAVVELVKLTERAEASVGYQINGKWWCRDLRAAGSTKAFRVTAKTLIELLGLERGEICAMAGSGERHLGDAAGAPSGRHIVSHR